jgi:HSP20 family protein
VDEASAQWYDEAHRMSFFSLSTPTREVEQQNWQDLTSNEGQLAVDVFREGKTLVIRSTLAGVDQNALDISIHGDLLTIRGNRLTQDNINEDDWFYRECYWGSFSRTIVLPLDVYPEYTDAQLHLGVLTIRLPIRAELHRLEIKQGAF